MFLLKNVDIPLYTIFYFNYTKENNEKGQKILLLPIFFFSKRYRLHYNLAFNLKNVKMLKLLHWPI